LWQIFDEVFITEEVYNEVANNNRHKNYREKEIKEAQDISSHHTGQIKEAPT
jgi:hypothetical protein